jgi:hypothetical protein
MADRAARRQQEPPGRGPIVPWALSVPDVWGEKMRAGKGKLDVLELGIM